MRRLQYLALDQLGRPGGIEDVTVELEAERAQQDPKVFTAFTCISW